MKLLSMHCVSDSAPHSAFTDLALFRDRLWCCFREGDSHALCAGAVRIMSSADGTDWHDEMRFTAPGADLRDPHFALRPDGKLELLMGKSTLEAGRYTDRCSVETVFDGATWTEPAPVCAPGDWLWRADWGPDGRAWGISYRLPAPRRWTVHLMTRRLDSPWVEHSTLPIKGLPNEATVRALDDGRLLVLLRRESDLLGTSRARALAGCARPKPERGSSLDAPRLCWRWSRLPWRVGGPNFIPLSMGGSVAGFRLLCRDAVGRRTGRCVLARTPWTAAALRAKRSDTGLKALCLSLELPSSGDASYPGLVERDGALWVSWYSSHTGKAAVYLGKVSLED